MGITLCFLSVLPVLAGWRWHYVVHKRRWKRVEDALDRLGEGNFSEAPKGFFSGNADLESVEFRMERLAGLQASMRQRLEYEEFSLRTVLSSMDDGVLVADDLQKIRLANPAFERIFGVESGGCIGRSVLEVIGEPEIYRLLQEAMKVGAAEQRQVEMVPGKKVRHVMVHAVSMSDLKGRPGVIAVFRDMSRLQELENVRREFVANVSHELRTPLAIFQGYVENLLEMPDLPTSDREEILKILSKHSQRLNALVEDLLVLARLEARREDFEWKSLPLDAFVREVVRDWRVRCQGQDLVVEVECEAELPSVRMDPLRIEQVLHNLLENARKHVPLSGGRVTVSLRSDEQSAGQHVVVCVEDNGVGIPLMDLPHIFERFYRGTKSRTRKDGSAHSSGLGLSIVKHIVAHHGGKVGASSPSGSGARVWFSLPTADLSSSAQIAES